MRTARAGEVGDLIVTAVAALTSEGGEPRTLGRLVDTEAIPMMLRRRLSGPAVMAIRCGLAALPAAGRPVELVSCSRHGDLPRTQRLLFGIVAGEPPSPLEFALSVHNALAGTLDLLRQERTGHTSIVAGRDTLMAALLELWMRLQVAPERAALLFYVEQPVPEELVDRTDAASGGGTVLALGFEHADATHRQAMASAPCGRRPIARLRRIAPGGGGGADSEVLARQIVAVLRDGGVARLPGSAGFDWQLASLA